MMTTDSTEGGAQVSVGARLLGLLLTAATLLQGCGPPGGEDIREAPGTREEVPASAASLSVAYFHMPRSPLSPADAALVAKENETVREAVLEHANRLLGFLAVNPLSHGALEEMERAAGREGLVGVKLHLANSDMGLRDPDQVDRLTQVVRGAGELGLGVAVHLRTRHPGYGREDALALIDGVLHPNPSVPVQLAHMAGWSSYDPATGLAMGAFVDRLEPGALDGGHPTWFDLSAVVRPLRSGQDGVEDGKVQFLPHIKELELQ